MCHEDCVIQLQNQRTVFAKSWHWRKPLTSQVKSLTCQEKSAPIEKKSSLNATKPSRTEVQFLCSEFILWSLREEATGGKQIKMKEFLGSSSRREVRDSPTNPGIIPPYLFMMQENSALIQKKSPKSWQKLRASHQNSTLIRKKVAAQQVRITRIPKKSGPPPIQKKIGDQPVKFAAERIRSRTQ